MDINECNSSNCLHFYPCKGIYLAKYSNDSHGDSHDGYTVFNNVQLGALDRFPVILCYSDLRMPRSRKNLSEIFNDWWRINYDKDPSLLYALLIGHKNVKKNGVLLIGMPWSNCGHIRTLFA